MDKPKMGGQSNLSLRSLAEEIRDQKLKAEFEELERQARVQVSKIITWRNKNLAHNDLFQHLKKADPVPPIYIRDFASAMATIRDALNLLHGRYFERECLYDKPVTQKDGTDLLFYLRYGLDCWNEDKANGNLSRADKLISQRGRS